MRLVSLAPSNTEILYRLGAEDNIIATTSLCDYPPGARKKTSVGGWSDGLDIEKVVEMDPDLALASDSLQDRPVEKLRNQGVKVVQVNPRSLKDVYSSIRDIGDLTGNEEEAEEIIEGMRQNLDKLELDGERIYCEEWSDPPMFSGNWVPGLVETVGGNYFVEEGRRSQEFELEKLKQFDPEYIFLNVCGAGDNVSREELVGRDGWQGLTAVENGNVFVVDDALLNRPGPRLVEGAKRIVEVVKNDRSQ